MTRTTVYVVLAVLFAITANFAIKATPVINFRAKTKKVIVTNTHGNFLSIRCFSFDHSLGVQHLKPWQRYTFKVHQRTLYPTATMYNCSTNMGIFVAFKHDYECAEPKSSECKWRFNLKTTSFFVPSKKDWVTIDYNPNYESLEKGGLVKGRYVN